MLRAKKWNSITVPVSILTGDIFPKESIFSGFIFREKNIKGN
jgi:hypothetical protein